MEYKCTQFLNETEKVPLVQVTTSLTLFPSDIQVREICFTGKTVAQAVRDAIEDYINHESENSLPHPVELQIHREAFSNAKVSVHRLGYLLEIEVSAIVTMSNNGISKLIDLYQ